MNDPYLPSPNENRHTPVTARDALFAWLTLPVCFLAHRAACGESLSLGGTAAILILFAFGFAYLRASGRRPGAVSLLSGAGCLLLSLNFITWTPRFSQELLFAALVLLFFCWVYDAAGLSGRGFLGERFFLHLPAFMLGHPLLGLGSIFPALSYRRSGEKKNTALYLLLGLGLAVIPTVTVLLLLSYDSNFTELLEYIFSDFLIELLRDLFFSALFSVLLFGVLFSARERSLKTGGAEEAAAPPQLHFAPAALLCAAVTPVLLVYALFFLSQKTYYLSAFTGVLPPAFTPAEYAREGFFQLCAVCAINALLLLLFNLLIRPGKSGKSLLTRIYSTVLILFTLILAATALSKLILYIGFFGLTRKRVCAAWLILLISALFLIALLRQWIRKIPFVPASVLCTFVFLCVLLLPNPDARIARCNVDAYLNGSLPTVDLEAMEELGASAVPDVLRLRDYLIRLDTPNEKQTELKKGTVKLLTDFRLELGADTPNLFDFNLPEQRARRLLFPKNSK